MPVWQFCAPTLGFDVCEQAATFPPFLPFSWSVSILCSDINKTYNYAEPNFLSGTAILQSIATMSVQHKEGFPYICIAK